MATLDTIQKHHVHNFWHNTSRKNYTHVQIWNTEDGRVSSQTDKFTNEKFVWHKSQTWLRKELECLGWWVMRVRIPWSCWWAVLSWLGTDGQTPPAGAPHTTARERERERERGIILLVVVQFWTCCVSR